MANLSDRRLAMNGIELAIRRVSDRLKGRVPWDMAVTEALDELADEICEIAAADNKTVQNLE
jgi:hypothetical protein